MIFPWTIFVNLSLDAVYGYRENVTVFFWHRWTGHCYWGYVGENGASRCSFTLPDDPSTVLLLGRNEDPAVKSKLLEDGFKAIEAPGAGYKILSVALGRAGAYVLSRGTTFRWDTCAPQGLLQALGGGIIDYAKFTSQTDPEDSPLRYSGDDKTFANRGGLIAYRDTETLESLRRALLKWVYFIFKFNEFVRQMSNSIF